MPRQFMRATGPFVWNNGNREPSDQSLHVEAGDLVPSDHWAVEQGSIRGAFEPVQLSASDLEAAVALWAVRDELATLRARHEGRIPGGIQERVDNLERRESRLLGELRSTRQSRERLEDIVRSGNRYALEAGADTGTSGTSEPGTDVLGSRRAPVFRGDPWREAVPMFGAPERAGELRARALAAVERCQRMPDAAREASAKMLQGDDDPESRTARYVLAASDPEYFRAFAKWFNDPTSGHFDWTPQERAAWRQAQTLTRALALGTSGGGFLVPYELDPSILISSAGALDPMREIARVEQTAQNEKRFVTSLGVTASWDAESAEVSDDTPTLLQPTITSYKGQAFVPVSFELFEDSDIAQQVGALFTDAKAVLEAAAFTTGSGTGQPRGIITALVAAATPVIATATNVLAQGDLYANQAALPARWRPNAKWMMNLSILNGYRQLPQASGLNYSIVNDDGPRPRILGWTVFENSSMDGSLGAGADYTVLSGDFRQYIIVDRLGTTVELVPHLIGANRRPTGERGFLLHWRAGGDVVIADAFRLTNHST